MNSEIRNQIRKVPHYDVYDGTEDIIFYWICYDNESKNIKHLKYLVETSPNLQWWENHHYTDTYKHCIVINEKPIINGTLN
jgi:hypothetical protein